MKKWRLWLWWGELVLMLAQVAMSVVLMLSLVRMDILKWQWLVLIGVGLVVMLALAVVPLCFRRKPMIALRIVGMVVSVVVIAGGIFALRYVNAFNGFLDKVSQAPMESNESVVVEEEKSETDKIDVTKDPFIVYISGSDSRIGVEDATASSDVNIAVVVNPEQGKILLVSIPRDTYVQLHGTTGLKDNLTFAGIQGIEMSKATVEDFLGIKIDYTVKVSFDTVVGVVDELGGIEIESDQELWVNTRWNGKKCHIVTGLQWVDGECALSFARERKSYSTGDMHRGENQQEVLTAIIKKISGSRDYLLNLPNILNVVADSFETSFLREDITAFIRKQLSEPVDWQIESYGITGEDGKGSSSTMGEGNIHYILIPNEESVQEAKSLIDAFLKSL